MIEVQLKDWEENDLQNKIVNKVIDIIIKREFKCYGKIPEEGCYTPYDKFKNYIANLVADRIFQYMISNEEIKNRINTAIEKAEKTIISQYMTKVGKMNEI